MNPFALFTTILAIGASAYGIDQHKKRTSEQATYRASLQQLEAKLATKEQELASVRSLCGDKNDQVRILAAEVERLRADIAGRRRSA